MTSKKVGRELIRLIRFAGAGVIITVFDYILYSAIMCFVFHSNTEMISCATVMSGTVSTFVAYMVHSHHTWKERDPGKYGIFKFFAWNIIAVSLLRPFISSVFEQLTGLFQFCYGISSGLGLPFTYEFIMSTIVYVLMIMVLTVMNYTVYARLVFNKERKVLRAIQKRRAKTTARKAAKKALKSAEAAKQQSRKQVNVERVRQTGKEQKRKRVAKKQRK